MSSETHTVRDSIADGGIETTLMDRLGQELREFAAFELLATAEGREALRTYYGEYVDLAAQQQRPLVLDTPTWRANADWGDRLGYDLEDLDAINADAVALVRQVIEDAETEGVTVEVNGCVGPRYDDHYASQDNMTAEESESYYGVQVRALAAAGADRITLVTTMSVAEGIGVVRAAVAERIPVAVSFVVGDDGRLASGDSVAEAIAQIDAATDAVALGYLVNCAHPSEVEQGLAACADDAYLNRIIGFRLNAAKEHEPESPERPENFAELQAGLKRYARNATVFGGCCGTDVQHIRALDAYLA